MLMFSMIVSGSLIFGSVVANDIDPSAITAIRFLFAFFLLFGIMGLQAKKKIKAFDSPSRYVSLAILISLYFVLMFEGLKTASAVSMSAIMTLTPFIAVILEYILERRKIKGMTFVALFIGALGSLWIIFDANFLKIISFNIGYGETLFFIGCVCQALYTVLVPKFNSGESDLEQTTKIMISSALIIILFDLEAITSTSWYSLGPMIWLTILYLSIFATAGAFFIIRYSRNTISGTNVMAYYYLVPMWVLIFEVLVKGNIPKFEIWLGCFAIILTFTMILSKDVKLFSKRF